MNEEEYFRKNYPDSCYGDKPLSPHWDFFQDGVEFGEREYEKRIEELENTNKQISKECHKLVDSLEKLQKENAELEINILNLKDDVLLARGCHEECTNQLTNAKEIIKNLISAYITYADSFDDRDNELIAEAENFLKESEVEK